MQMDPIAKAAFTKLLEKIPGSAEVFLEKVEEQLKQKEAPAASAASAPVAAVLFSPGTPRNLGSVTPFSHGRLEWLRNFFMHMCFHPLCDGPLHVL